MKSKQTKREEAELRNKKYKKLSKDEKLALLASRRGESKRERARIVSKIKAEGVS